MPEIPTMHRCLNLEDKKLILKIIDEAISRENMELKKIEVKKMRSMGKPPFVESFTGIRSSLVKVHEDFRKDLENLKIRVEGYHKCIISDKPSTDVPGVTFLRPEYEIPVSQRKIF